LSEVPVLGIAARAAATRWKGAFATRTVVLVLVLALVLQEHLQKEDKEDRKQHMDGMCGATALVLVLVL